MTPPNSASLTYLIWAHSKMDMPFNCPAPPHSHLKIVLLGSWLAHSVEHGILDLEVVSSRPTLGVEITFLKILNKYKKKKKDSPLIFHHQASALLLGLWPNSSCPLCSRVSTISLGSQSLIPMVLYTISPRRPKSLHANQTPGGCCDIPELTR